jgi:hypothetical protein
MSNTTKLIIGGVVVFLLLRKPAAPATPTIPTFVPPTPPTNTPPGGTSAAQDAGSILSGLGALFAGVAKAADAFRSPGNSGSGADSGAGASTDYTPSQSQREWWAEGNQGPV